MGWGEGAGEGELTGALSFGPLRGMDSLILFVFFSFPSKSVVITLSYKLSPGNKMT